MNKYFLSDMSVMVGRSMRHIFRSMDTIITVTIMPIAMMLLFVYVLGGAIQTGADNYVNYLLPGILLIAIANSIGYTSFRLFNDVQRGIFERFHSMPISRSNRGVRDFRTCDRIGRVQARDGRQVSSRARQPGQEAVFDCQNDSFQLAVRTLVNRSEFQQANGRSARVRS